MNPSDATFQIRIEGLDALEQALREFPSVVRPILDRAFVASQAVLSKYTIKDIVPWRTGNLLQSFRFHVGSLEARWMPTAAYAPFVEYGRGFVYPRAKKVLSWRSSSGGGYTTAASGRRYYRGGQSSQVFSRFSRPSRPKPFMQRILDRATPDIEKVFVEALEQVNSAVAKARTA